MEVFERVDDLDRLAADLVGSADGPPAADAAAGEDDVHRLGVVVAPDLAAVRAVVRGAAELPTDHDQRIVEQVAPPEVLDQRGQRSVDRGDAVAVRLLQVVVGVPAHRVDLDEAHPPSRPAAALTNTCARNHQCACRRCRTSRGSPRPPRRCRAARAPRPACGRPARSYACARRASRARGGAARGTSRTSPVGRGCAAPPRGSRPAAAPGRGPASPRAAAACPGSVPAGSRSTSWRRRPAGNTRPARPRSPAGPG